MMRSLLLLVCVVVIPSAAMPQRVLNEVTLRWDGPTEHVDGTPADNLVGYRVYRSRQPIPDDGTGAVLQADIPATTGPGGLGECRIRLRDTGVPADLYCDDLAGPPAVYYYRVVAYDDRGIESALSTEISLDNENPFIILNAPINIRVVP